MFTSQLKMSQKSKRREKYALSDLLAAKNAVSNGEMTGYRAAQQFSIPKATIYQSIKDNSTSNKLGRNTLLTAEEEAEIVSWIIECAERGFPQTRSDVITAGTAILHRKPGNNKAQVGKDWYTGFRKRHPEIVARAVSVVSRASAIVSENNIRGWHRQITEYFTKIELMHFLLEHLELIHNGDETAFMLQPTRSEKVLRNAEGRTCSKSRRAWRSFR